MSDSVSISVVVPATDSPTTMERCAAAIRRSIVVPDEIVVVETPTRLSAAAARNAGVERAHGDVIVFVDADVEVHPDAIGRIRDAFEADPDLTAVCGSYDDRPAAPGVISVFRNLLHHHVHQMGAGPAETFWTGLGAVRRSAVVAAGGFDEDRYPHPSIEDIELGHRLRAAGGRLRIDPRIQGTHLKAWTFRSMLWTDFARRGVPWVDLQLRERRMSRALNCGWRHRLSALVCTVAVAAAAVGAPVVAGAAVPVLVAANHRFYGLLLRRLGPGPGAAGIALHGVHHLVSVAAVTVAIALWAGSGALRTATRRRRAPADRAASAVAG